MRSKRRERGSAIAEFGMSLFVIFIVLFFPMVDLAAVCTTYGFCWYFNSMETRELSCRTKAEGEGGTVHQELVNAWKQTGFHSFIGGESTTYISQVSYEPSDTVTNTTRITTRPFLTVPFFNGVPALGAPYTVVITSSRLREETK